MPQQHLMLSCHAQYKNKEQKKKKEEKKKQPPKRLQAVYNDSGAGLHHHTELFSL